MKNIKISQFLIPIFFSFFLISLSCEADEKTDTCTKVCQTGETLNSDTCECEKDPCTKTCPAGEILNDEKCECEKEPCTKTCPTGEILNSDTCECEKEPCTKTCPTGEVLNSDTCECEKEVCTKTCANGETLNADTCECEQPAFVPTTIEVDASVVTLAGSWKKRTTIAGYTGEGYIVWEGPSQFWKGEANIGKAGLLTYEIEIEKTGTYLFKWRSYIAKKDPNKPTTEHNDSWLRFPEAAKFFAKKPFSNSILYPKGSGKSPNPDGENGNGFFKVYMNTADAWTNISSTSDNNAHEIFVTFNEAKKYIVEIAARSDFHAIDSFKLTLQKP